MGLFNLKKKKAEEQESNDFLSKESIKLLDSLSEENVKSLPAGDTIEDAVYISPTMCKINTKKINTLYDTTVILELLADKLVLKLTKEEVEKYKDYIITEEDGE